MKIGYKRVSTLHQNPDRQLEGMQFHRVFIDFYTGRTADRPQLQEMLQFAREGDAIYVHSLDRMARNLKDLREMLDFLTKKGVSITFVKENLTFNDKKNPMAELLLSVMGAIAEFEHALIQERLREGVAIAKRKGKYKGRKPCLSPDQVEKMKKMIEAGYSIVDIAKHFFVTRQTVYKYLKREKV